MFSAFTQISASSLVPFATSAAAVASRHFASEPSLFSHIRYCLDYRESGYGLDRFIFIARIGGSINPATNAVIEDRTVQGQNPFSFRQLHRQRAQGGSYMRRAVRQ
jgi:hypothetical protein